MPSRRRGGQKHRAEPEPEQQAPQEQPEVSPAAPEEAVADVAAPVEETTPVESGSVVSPADAEEGDRAHSSEADAALSLPSPARKDEDLSTVPSPSDETVEEEEAARPSVQIPPVVAAAIVDAKAAKPHTLPEKLLVGAMILRAVAIAVAVWALIFVLEALHAAQVRFPKRFAKARAVATDLYAKARAAIGCAEEECTLERLRTVVPFAAQAAAKVTELDARYANGRVQQEIVRAYTDGAAEFRKSCPPEVAAL
eukprot:CAMPEP_0174839154 /NCGR_PEP_ID=MMETSP1114-20130205/7863_1 /TAXON_ID=312471 /ORGANISM="Neobodo designis, Strain CCAP 1951/1" /LENGTH=253 /DNA_ID=CAMNT_0016073275 /DNA_START=44 /DNA_END=805 /DNA_ORIENTATION=+